MGASNKGVRPHESFYIPYNAKGDAAKQVIVFVFFGEKYMEQFDCCLKTIPAREGIEIVVITDTIEYKGFCLDIIKVPTPATLYDMLTFRSRIPDFIDVNKYSQVWYSDVDILFKGDILDKYKHATDVMISHEPNAPLRHPFINAWFNEQELQQMEAEHAPAINSGFFCVPKQQKDFWIKYKALCQFTGVLMQNKESEQCLMNHIYHRKQHSMKLFDTSEVCFRPDETGEYGMVNHYIGMGSDKVDIMRNELIKIKTQDIL